MNETKRKNFTKTSLLFYFLKGSLGVFFISILCNLIFTLCYTTIPQIISFAVDCVIDTKEASPMQQTIANIFGGVDELKQNIWIIAAVVIGISLISAIFRFLNSYFHGSAHEILMKRMRNKLFSHIQRMPIPAHSKYNTGDLIQRCTSDTETVSMFVSEQLMSLFRFAILISLSLSFMYSMNPTLAIIPTVGIPTLISLSVIFYNIVGKNFMECDKNEGILSTYAQENFTGVRVVKAFGRENYEKQKFETQNQKYTKLWMKVCKYLAFYWGAGDILSAVQLLIITVLGTIFCIDGTLSLGNLIAFISYYAILAGPVRSVGRIITDMSKAGVSLTRICEVMNVEEEPINDESQIIEGDITFEDVSFSYEDDKPVLSNVSFKIPQGTTLGIIGATGSGKSTLVELLDGLYTNYQGTITFGGKDIKEIPLSSLRKSIGIVLQEPFLFSKTVGENIAISQTTPDMDAVKKAAHVACVDENIEGFAKGYDTIVGERGVTLSGGQKQRVAIARTVLMDMPVIIFDDSLSAVDSETDAKIRANLLKECKNATVIIISHRVTTLLNADNIIVLDKGKVIESGTSEQLIAKNGTYRTIYDMQMSLPDELKQEVQNG